MKRARWLGVGALILFTLIPALGFPLAGGIEKFIRARGFPLGAGIDGVADWSRTLPFNDLVHQGRAFGSADTPWDEAVPRDAQGWPTQDCGIVLLVGVSEVGGLGGTYKVSFECATTPQIALVASPGQIQNVQRTGNLVTADLVFPEGGDQMMLNFRNTQGGIRNLKVMRPGGTANPGTFHPVFLSHLRRFSTLRFMDWTNTNFNPTRTWAERNTPASPIWRTGGGMPWEVCIDLANSTRKHVWVNVPHMADDNYVRQMARLFRDTLDPRLLIYVEYSNEVWNWSFSQSQYNLQAARDEVAAGGSVLNYDGSTNEGVWAARRIAKRLKEIRDIFAQEFGKDLGSRVRPVFCTQVGWTGHWLYEGLKFANAVYGPPSQYFYGIGIAPYFNLGSLHDTDGLSKIQVLDAMESSVDALATDYGMETSAAMGAYYGLDVLGYEGGPDTFGGKSIQSKREASHDPRMQVICEKYLGIWYGWGFGLFNWFVAGAGSWTSPYGTWTLTEDYSDPATPKMLALDAVTRRMPPPQRFGEAVPGTIDARRHAFRGANWQNEPYLRDLWGNNEFFYFLRNTGPRGNYTIEVERASDQVGGAIEVWVDNKKVGEIPGGSTGGWESWAFSTPLKFTMTPGAHGVRLFVRQPGGVNIRSVRIKRA